MIKLNKLLDKVINSINGRIICIGNLDINLIEKLKKNANILYCDLLNCNMTARGISNTKQKKLSMKDFRKHYKKKKIDYIICDIKDIKMHLPRFVQDSIYIGKHKLYIYGSKDECDILKLQKKYNRYNVKTNLIEEKSFFLLEIDITKTKNKWLKDKLYFVQDSLEIIFDKISDMIVS